MRRVLLGLICGIACTLASGAVQADTQGWIQTAQNMRGGLQGAIVPLEDLAGPQTDPGTNPIPQQQQPGDQASDAETLYQRGDDYYFGRGVAQDYLQALDWYQRAAQFDHAEALYSIGYLYAYGQGVAQNYGEARNWFLRAADQNHANSIFELGQIYWGEENYAESAFWHRRAADLGVPSSMVNIAILLDEGRGVGADHAASAYYLVRAYVLGNESAQNWLFEASDQWTVNTRIEVQRILRNAGTYSGALDGALGPGSRSALETYRRQQGG